MENRDAVLRHSQLVTTLKIGKASQCCVRMEESTRVLLSRELLQAIFEGAKRLFPRESILLLRGKKEKDLIVISELVVPPLATYGQRFASLPLHMLPIDFSIIGTVHSHPSGKLTPSTTDLNRSFGRIIMIVSYPFANEQDIAVYNSSGERLRLQMAKD